MSLHRVPTYYPPPPKKKAENNTYSPSIYCARELDADINIQISGYARVSNPR